MWHNVVHNIQVSVGNKHSCTKVYQCQPVHRPVMGNKKQHNRKLYGNCHNSGDIPFEPEAHRVMHNEMEHICDAEAEVKPGIMVQLAER